MLGDFASLDVQNTYRGSDAYGIINNCRSFRSRFYTPFVTLILSLRAMEC
ncbi:hypothetical protein [Piscirickettsia salmonis]|nr:hypothetical protein [Piscirickettsia salmonis]